MTSGASGQTFQRLQLWRPSHDLPSTFWPHGHPLPMRAARRPCAASVPWVPEWGSAMSDFYIETAAIVVTLFIVVPSLLGLVGETPAKKRENFAAGVFFVAFVLVLAVVSVGLFYGISWLIRLFIGGAA